MKIARRKSKIIKIGNLSIGGNYPIAIQSMAKVKTSCLDGVLKQIKELQDAGCEIVRLAVKDTADAKAIRGLKRSVKLPLVADIHFNWRLAIEAIDNGIDKIRLNPGNIYKKDEVREIAAAAKLNRIPIRVGVNSGSLRNRASPATQARDMVKPALDYLKLLEGFKFYDIVISLKASNIPDTIEAYQLIAKSCIYPLHLGVTATGSSYSGALKSSIALGALLSEGIGDTIRVSLTDKPAQEVIAARIILEALGLRHFGPEIISCPTCGRCEVDLVSLVKELENRLSTIDYRLSTKPPKVALMGCVVNGPGEAQGVDLGVAFGKKEGLLFRKGKVIKRVSEENCIESLLKEMRRRR